MTMLKEMRKDIDKALAALAEEASGTFALPSGNSILADSLKDYITRDGKRVRPLLFMLSYRGYAKQSRSDRHELAKLAASMELVHDYLLIHDDLIDRSPVRRSAPSMHRVYNHALKRNKEDRIGYSLGIIAGDILYAYSISNLFSFPEKSERILAAARVFLEKSALTAKGEFADILNDLAPLDRIKNEEILDTYALKTASYTFHLPLLAGAVLAGVRDAEEHRLIGSLSLDLGLAFQIQDDLLDIYMPAKDTGKKNLSDLAESKKTLFARKAYSALSVKDKSSFRAIFRKDRKTRAELLRLKRLADSTGAGRWCLDRSRSHLARARSAMEALKMRKDMKNCLAELVDMIFALSASIEKNIEEQCA